MTLKPSGFDPDFYGCPKSNCDWPLDPTMGEWEDTGGGVTCACGAFVPLPDIPVPVESIYRERYETNLPAKDQEEINNDAL